VLTALRPWTTQMRPRHHRVEVLPCSLQGEGARLQRSENTVVSR
jgi:hypothetical protein